MEQLQGFLQEQWMIIAIALVVLIVVVKLVKTAIKWAIILLIVAGIFVYGANYKDTLTSIKDAVVENAGGALSDAVKEQAANAIRNEAKDATYTANADGSFTVKSKTIQVDGKPGSDTVKVTIAGQSFNMKTVDAVNAYLEAARKSQ
jgi:hypothetical protein